MHPPRAVVGVAGYRDRSHGLAGMQTRAKAVQRSVGVRQLERLCSCARRRQRDRLPAVGQRHLSPLAPPRAQRPQRLLERPRQVDLIEQQKGVVPEQAGMDRSHRWPRAVPAEQEPRPYLVHCRHGDEWLVRAPRPSVVPRNAAAHQRDRNRIFVRHVSDGRREMRQPLPNGLEGRVPERPQFRSRDQALTNAERTCVGLVHDGAPVDHHHDAAWCAPRRRLEVGLCSERVHGDIKRCRLSSSCRNTYDLRPPAVGDDILREASLPGVREIAVHRLEVVAEGGKLGERGHWLPPCSGAHSPRPA